MKQLLILLTSFFFLNCSTQNQPKEVTNPPNAISEPVKKEIEITEETPIPESKPLDSSFNSFLIEFSASEEFQLARVDFPFTIKLVDIMADEDIQTIAKNEWQYSNLLDTADIETRQYDKYSQTTEIEDTLATIKLRGIDNGIRIDYTFQLRGGRWYLIQIFNTST